MPTTYGRARAQGPLPSRGSIALAAPGRARPNSPSVGSIVSSATSGEQRAAAVTEEAPFQRRSVVPVAITLEEAYTGTVRTIQLPPGGPNGHAGKRIEVRVPAGTKHESRIHVNTAKGGAHADIELTVSIAPHHLFERTGDDLRFTAKVPLIDAVLGGETDVPTLSGSTLRSTSTRNAERAGVPAERERDAEMTRGRTETCWRR